MKDGKFILVNGSFVPADDHQISFLNLDEYLFSEKIRAVRTRLPFFKPTLEIIKLKLSAFNLSFPEMTDHDGAGLRRQLERTLTRNKHFMGSELIIRFWLNSKKIQYAIQCTKTEDIEYELNTKGLFVDIFQSVRKSASSLSSSVLGSEIFWRIASRHLISGSTEQLLLLNTHDQLVEAIGSNVYVIKKDLVMACSAENGAYVDLTKPLITDIIGKLNLIFTDTKPLTLQDIIEAEEIFLVNAVSGIQWVAGFEGKRYFNQNIRRIHELFVKEISTLV